MTMAGYAYGNQQGIYINVGQVPGIFYVGHTTLNHSDHGLAIEQSIRSAVRDFVNGSHWIDWQFTVGRQIQGRSRPKSSSTGQFQVDGRLSEKLSQRIE
jgi:hypothetical protein